MSAEISALVIQFAIVAFLLLANGFFVAAEFALVSVRRTRIEELIAAGNSTAETVKRVIHDPDRFIAATQLGITIASLGLGWVAEPTLAHVIEPVFKFLPAAWGNAAAHTVAASGVAFAFVTFLHVVIGELAPKSIALAYPEETALIVARPTMLFENFFRPVIWVLNGAGNGLLKLLGLRRPAGHQLVHSVEELKMLVSASTESGELEPREKEMLHNVFAFSDKTVREVMTPRPAIVAVDEDSTIAEFLQTFRESAHERFPVYANSVDNIIGFVAIKDILRALAANADARADRIGALARLAIIVPEAKRVGSLLAEMQAQQVQLAVVIDEFGGTAGIVTLEALIEEIVGRLSDKFAQEKPRVETIDAQSSQVDAQLRVEEVNEQMSIEIPPSDDYETLAGFILHALRHIPKEGEQFRVGNVRVTITRMDGPKVERVLITRL
ncbi:MAG: HlyC/CorC family transporter [Chloroflexi bacterium]|nr:HlyC/CorC family transporter [Chloroflexota bacterium]